MLRACSQRHPFPLDSIDQCWIAEPLWMFEFVAPKRQGFDEDADAEAPKAEEESEKRTQFQAVLEALRSVLQNQFQVLNVLETSA